MCRLRGEKDSGCGGRDIGADGGGYGGGGDGGGVSNAGEDEEECHSGWIEGDGGARDGYREIFWSRWGALVLGVEGFGGCWWYGVLTDERNGVHGDGGRVIVDSALV